MSLTAVAGERAEVVGLTAEDSKPEELVIDGAEQLRVLSQPARLISFDELFTSQKALTATQLAAHTGVSPSSMSYHLRELERVGLVRRGNPGTDGRERRWEAPARAYTILVSRIEDVRGRLAAVDTYLSPLRSRIADKLSRNAATDGGDPDDGETALATGRLFLTEQELRGLQRAIAEIWQQYEERGWRRGHTDRDVMVAHYAWSLLVDHRTPPPTGS